MKKVFLVIVSALVMVNFISAHELRTTVILGSYAVRIEVTYPGGDPVSAAQVNVYLPGLAQEEYLKGQTDRNGAFAFCPDRSGVWTAMVDDQMGHRESLFITIPENSSIIQNKMESEVETQERIKNDAGLPQVFKVIWGLSLLFGICGIWYWIKATKLMKGRALRK